MQIITTNRGRTYYAETFTIHTTAIRKAEVFEADSGDHSSIRSGQVIDGWVGTVTSREMPAWIRRLVLGAPMQGVALANGRRKRLAAIKDAVARRAGVGHLAY